MNIFISGSIDIKTISDKALEKIDSIISKEFSILIGDAYGIDLEVQKYLLQQKYEKVCVYYAGERIRNNKGNWDSKKIIPKNNEKGRALYTLKDIEMAKDAHYGLMIWNGNSKGTYNNMLNMKKLYKKFVMIKV